MGEVLFGYKAKDVAWIVGIDYARLDYWARTRLIVPSLGEADGRGSKRLYSFLDIIALKVVKVLRDQGVSLQRLKKVADYLGQIGPELENPLANAIIITDGLKVFRLINHPGTVQEVLGMGQLVWAISLGRLVTEIKKKAARVPKSTFRAPSTEASSA